MQENGREGHRENQYYVEAYEPHEHAISNHIRQLEQEAEEEIHLRDYLHVLMRRKWIVLAFFVSVVVTVTLSTFMMKPLYKSSVTLRIDKEDPNVLTFKDVYQIERADEDYYQTQYQVLRSRNIAKRVIRKLNLDQHPEFLPSSGTSVKSAILGFLSPSGGEGDDPIMEDGVETRLIDAFGERLEVTPERKSQLVKVSFISHDFKLSKKVSNTIAETYIDFNIESKFDATQRARKWLQGQIEIMKAKVETSEEKLNEYSAGNEMIFLDENKDKESLLTQKLSELSTALSEATADRIQKEAIYNQIKESGAENPIVSDNPLILGLKNEYATLEAEYSNQLKIYKPEYPKMKSLKSQMVAISKRIQEEKGNIIKSIESDYNAALKREEYLAQAFVDEKNRALDFQRRTVQYQILKREVDTNKELYINLLQRLKEVGVSATMTATNIQILDRAELPRAPFKPKKALNILLSIIVGLMGGVGLAFFVEYLDNTVKDTQEIERRMHLPTLGIIPQHKSTNGGNGRLISHDSGHMSEAFRSIGTFVQFSSASKPPKTMLVTSPREQEGKTTTIVNTAIALTESLDRGLIIDADLRRPMIHKVLELDNSVGLSTFLSGNVEFDDDLRQITSFKGLDVITAGPIPPNPSALLGSARMKDLLDAMGLIYDFILIDSAPLLGLTDSIYLGNSVDGVILVVKAGQTPKNTIKEAKRVLQQVNANILGVAINGIKENDLKYGYYSYYYSSSYYKESKASS